MAEMLGEYNSSGIEKTITTVFEIIDADDEPLTDYVVEIHFTVQNGQTQTAMCVLQM